MIGASFHAIGIRSGSLDPLTVAYAELSGATDLAGIDAVIRYVRAESLLSNFVMYPMKSAQNAGTGATAYGLGGLTSNEMTLTNGPTWGASGLAFSSGSSQYGEIVIPGFYSITELTVFVRTSPVNASVADTSKSTVVYAGITSNSWWSGNATGTTSGETISAGVNNANRRVGSSLLTWSAGEDHTYVYNAHSTGANWWKNKSSIATDKTANVGDMSPSSATYATDEKVVFSAGRSNATTYALFCNQTSHALAFLTGTVTTTQRETITDFINAL
jgi:hypothetical protein